MIRANELRKGVLIIDYTGYIREVTGEDIQQQCWYEEGQTGTTEAPLNPIPLTPEWLERCGLFEKGSSYEGDLRFKGCGHLIIEVIENGGLGYFAPFNKTIEIKYLHQLQNLYFALTGEELNMRP